MKKIDLKGTWGFCLDKEKIGIDKKYYDNEFEDTIELPATVSTAKKGVPSDEEHTGFLTDPYLFEGYTWYTKTVEITDTDGKEYFLVLERTRISHVWVNDIYIGCNDSLNSSHRYCLAPYLNKKNKLTIMIDNTAYPVKGGHMTSPDTQTNWNGITGEIYIEECSKVYLTGVKIYPKAAEKLIEVELVLNGVHGSESYEDSVRNEERVVNEESVVNEDSVANGESISNEESLSNKDTVGNKESDSNNRSNTIDNTIGKPVKYQLTARVSQTNEEESFPKSEYALQGGENFFTYYLDETAKTWSEHTPILYSLQLQLKEDNKVIDQYSVIFGLRDFKAVGKYFEVNGIRTFLRGKHDGLIFPMTGHAPTDVESWLKVLGIAKDYGMNHYRFHTCCPPEAAFRAADQLGIYMEPELPFWGTVTEEGEENHDEKAQQYLIEEGYRILDEFGNHPSFVMMSLGNELWGSKERLNEILGNYKKYDTRHLYTQGSNNFQFMPCILENEDFFCGVRFGRDRLFRGSYAMCDAPQGHIQTVAPNMNYNYDAMIRPNNLLEETKEGGEVTIQYGTGTKTVKVDASKELIPEVPVVSHEIGQFAMYPDFSEIDKYTGVLKARNFEVFKRRLVEKGMLPMAERFFKASGRFAAECYKAEFETALRSNELAGFQVLDLQDFTGQGTALIGILNSFMENKGVISVEEWQQFCADTVLLAELPRLTYTAGETMDIPVKLAAFGPEVIVSPKVKLTVFDGEEVLLAEEMENPGEYVSGVYQISNFRITLPKSQSPKKLKLQVRLMDTNIKNTYDIWLYPELNIMNQVERNGDALTTDNLEEAITSLKEGKKVLYYPEKLKETNSIEGTYCTDFWCYPMFRSISESMGRPVPIGTLGLLIDEEHSIFKEFPTEYYTTPQWYDIVSNSRALIMDDIDFDMEPFVWSIDNFERNHKLANIFECKIGAGKLLVCTSNLSKLKESYPAKWLAYSILKYINSEEFEPKVEIGIEKLKRLFD